MSMVKDCILCGAEFEISLADLNFYEKVSPIFNGKKFVIPVPYKCFSCRNQQRMMFRNESSLYHRKCSKTGENIIAMYDENVSFPVYAPKVWFGDSWDARDYGQEFDFSRPFFEQFVELRNKVPHIALVSSNNQNCDFCNIVGDCKDCYLIYGSILCEDCYYGSPFKCKKCCDSLLLRNSELCLQCVDSDKLYYCVYCQNCSNSRDLKFCFSVHNCSDCFCCVNLNHKQYCILNKQYSKEDYEKILSEMDLSKYGVLADVFSKLDVLKKQLPQRSYIGTNNEDVSGNYIFNCKDSHNVYGVAECRDTSHAFQILQANDSVDINNGECGELIYEVMAFYGNVSRANFSYFVWDSIDSLWYCAHCNKNVRDCFGSVGLKHAQYCILNKQYSKEEYEKMVAKIIEHMQKPSKAGQAGEWGQFFPADVSTFSYNESVANEYYPLNKEQILSKGYRWKELDGAENKGLTDAQICEVTKKPFRIIPQEKALYEKFGLALPKRSPKQRHLDRVSLRNPMFLWDRKCDKCGNEMKSSYAKERIEKVYCEDCYLKEVY